MKREAGIGPVILLKLKSLETINRKLMKDSFQDRILATVEVKQKHIQLCKALVFSNIRWNCILNFIVPEVSAVQSVGQIVINYKYLISLKEFYFIFLQKLETSGLTRYLGTSYFL